MYDPTYAHYVTMTLYEDRLRLAAAGARTRPGRAIRALRALGGRAMARVARRSTPALGPQPATTSCTP